MEIMIKKRTEIPFQEFLEAQDFIVEKVTSNIYKVNRNNLDVFVNVDSDRLFFEVDLGDIRDYAGKEFYESLLDLNTEILPVSIGLDTTTSDHKRLIIVESRETKNLDDNEILSVFEAIYIAYVKTSNILAKFIK